MLSEGWRNVITGAARPALGTIAAGALFTVTGAADQLEVARLVDDAEHVVHVGGTTLVVTAAGEIDATACDNLATIPGVTAAGAIRPANVAISFPQIPGNAVPARAASSGFVGLLRSGGTIAPDGIYVSVVLADRLGVRRDDQLASTNPPNTWSIAGVIGDPERSANTLAYTVITLAPRTQPFDECWIETVAGTDVGSLVLAAHRPPGLDNPVPATVTQLNSSLGDRYDTNDRYTHRRTRLAPVIAAIVGGIVGVVLTRARRLEHTTALHLGITRHDLTLITLVEAALTLVPAVGITTAVHAIVGRGIDPTHRFVGLWLGLRCTLAGTIAYLIAITLTTITANQTGMIKAARWR